MATVNIFASFEYGKDKKIRGDFYGQAKTLCPHRVRNCSLREAYPTDEWKSKARAAIKECDVVIILAGEDTHNAKGVATEVDIARDLEKPIFQIRTKRSTSSGVEGIDLMRWRWKRINRKIGELVGA